ncbi:MAG: dipeptide ABC transporter ATP-binding protein [Rhodoferax sp.]
MNNPPLLRVQDLTVRFGAQTVVDGLSFALAAGECVALVGESGSGKSVSALSMLRLVADAHISGQAWFDGRDLLGLPESALRGVRGGDIAMVFQEPMTALNPVMTVGQQIIEVLQLKQGLGLAEARARAVQLLADTGLPEPERRLDCYPHQLSGGQRQRAMIAMALAGNPRLLLADEPTTALDVSLRAQILDLLARLSRERGMAVLLITHDLNLVRRFAQRVLVMARGVLVEQGATAELFARPQQAYTQTLLASQPTAHPQLMARSPAGLAKPLLRTQALSVDYPVPRPGWRGWFSRAQFAAVRQVDLALAPGTCLGVMGESGSGKSSLALAVLALLPCQGEIWVDGLPWGHAVARNAMQARALRARVQAVFQDPFSSLSPRLTVEEIVGEGLRVHAPALSARQRRARVLKSMVDVGLVSREDDAWALLGRYPHEFSGGQRQRLAIARALIVEPALLVLDEPTSALDVTVQQQVLQLLQRLQLERNLAYLLITHDVAVIQAMAQSVLVMKDGVAVEQGPTVRVLHQPQHPYTRSLLHASGWGLDAAAWAPPASQPAAL